MSGERHARIFALLAPTVLAAQWGRVDVPRRERLAARLLAGEPLPDMSRQYLRALSGPVFVVAHTPAGDAEAFAEPTYRLVHEAPDARVYRVSA